MKAVDVSFGRISKEWAERRFQEGYRMFIACLWTGGYQRNQDIRLVAQANLKDAREAGFITAGYLNTNPWFEAAISLAEAQRNAGAEWDSLAYVFNDAEIDGITEAQIKAHCEAIVATGKPTAIYSAKWFWDRIGNPQWPWLTVYPLWVAQYDSDPKAPVRLFGPWKDVFGKQYQGTTNLDGVEVDLNEFDLEDDMDPVLEAKLKRFFLEPHGQASYDAAYPGRENWTQADVVFVALAYLDSVHLVTIFEGLKAIKDGQKSADLEPVLDAIKNLNLKASP